MIRSFYDRGTEDVFNRRRTKAARSTCPEQLWRVAQRKLDQLNAAGGQHSMRINDQYRVCFIWTDEGPERVEITDYH